MEPRCLEDILHAGGFILTVGDEGVVPDRFVSRELPDGRVLRHDPLLPTHVLEPGPGEWFALLGICLDVLGESADLAALSRKGVGYWQAGEQYFHRWLDQLGGRFVIAFNLGGVPRMYTDAFASRSVFRAMRGDHVVAASHTELVLGHVGDRAGSRAQEVRESAGAGAPVYPYPAHFTPWEGIFHVTPNTFLDLVSGNVERYYPREPLASGGDVPGTVLWMRELVRTQLRLLRTLGRPLVMSLTGGVDSRFTLACIDGETDGIEFFCYDRGTRATSDDVMRARAISEEKGLDFRVIKSIVGARAGEEGFQAFEEVLRRNTYLSHGFQLAYDLAPAYPREAIHITSDIAEVFQCRWGQFAWYWDAAKEEFSPRTMVRAYAAKDCLDGYEELFSQFHSETDFLTNRTSGYDPFDLFYWEHRMGTWRGHVRAEQDAVFDAISPFNCRILVEAGLRLPTSQRFRQHVLRAAIEDFLPDLADISLESGRGGGR